MNYYDAGIYGKIGELVKENLIFSYFYPAERKSVLYPNYTKDGFGFGSKGDERFLLTKEEFEKEFITSYVSTALDKSSKTAEDGSIHEFELIKGKSNGKETIFVGYLFAKEGNINGDYSVEFSQDKPFIKKNYNFPLFDVINNIQVGGERNYGFGWLELQDSPVELDRVNLYDSDVFVDLNDLILNSDKFIALAHVDTKNLELDKIKGDLEPVIGRKWDNERGAGQNLSNALICLIPGTKFKPNLEIKIRDFGMWI